MSLQIIPAHIDNIRMMIRQTSDDSEFTDLFLYKQLVDSRALVLTHELNKGRYVSEFNLQTFCMPFEPSTYHDCSCVSNSKCLVLKSQYELPYVLHTEYKSILTVSDLSGIKITDRGSIALSRLYQHTKTMGNQPFYDVVNSRVVVVNENLGKKVFLLEGLFYDPVSLSKIKVTNVDGTCQDSSCYVLATSRFPMDPELNETVYKMVLAKLGIPMQVPEDRRNDGKSNERIPQPTSNEN